MPADLIHFSCEKRWGEQQSGCAVLVPCGTGRTVPKIHDFLLPRRVHSKCKCKLLAVARCCETGQLTQLQGYVFIKKELFCSFLSTCIQWRQNKREQTRIGSATKGYKPLSTTVPDCCLRPRACLFLCSISSWACSLLPNFF